MDINIIFILLMLPPLTWIYLLRKKSNAFPTFLNFKKLGELQLNCKIQSLQTDWGGEYSTLIDFFVFERYITQVLLSLVLLNKIVWLSTNIDI